MGRNPDGTITDYYIAGLVILAFAKAARLGIVHNGFKCIEMYLFNRDMFTDLDFLPSLMTNMKLEPAFIENPSCNTSASDARPQSSTSRHQKLSCNLILQPFINLILPHQPLKTSANQASTTIISLPSTSCNKQPSISLNSVDQLLKQLPPFPDASNKSLVTRSRKTDARDPDILTLKKHVGGEKCSY